MNFIKVDSYEKLSTMAAEIIADVVTAMEKGMHRADPAARMIAYDWAWKEKAGDVNTVPFRAKVMDLLPESVV